MAAGSPVAAAPAVSIAQIKIDSDVAATADTASEAAIADTAAAAATAKIAVGAAASEAVTTPVKPQAIQTDATAATDAALTAAVAPTSPVASKTTLPKFPVASQAKAASSGSADSATSEPPANATPIEAARSNLAQQPAAAAKQEAGNNIVDTAKTDASANSSSASAATVAAHDHSTVAGTGHAPTEFVGRRSSGDRHVPAAASLYDGHGCGHGTFERHGGNQCAGAVERARARDRRLGTKRQEPFRNPARSGRSWPHRCSHRCRSQRPGDFAFDGRKAGNAVDAAPGRTPVAARAG